MELATIPYGCTLETVREETPKEWISARGLKKVRLKLGRRGEIVNIEEVSPKGYYIVRPCPKGVDRVKAVDYALRQNGIKYSVATIFSIALTLLTPKIVAFDFRRRGNALICSALVARSWEHGGWMCPSDPFQITPAELAWITQPKGQLP